MKFLVSFAATLILWVLLFSAAQWAVLLAGALFALLAAATVGTRFPVDAFKLVDPRRWFFALLYVPYFTYYVIKANLDVAFRVIDPDVPIRPGIVKVRTTLTSELAKAFLANSITLTPGTLTLDIDGQDLYIHWINVSPGDPQKRTAEIVGHFEPFMRRIFE